MTIESRLLSRWLLSGLVCGALLLPGSNLPMASAEEPAPLLKYAPPTLEKPITLHVSNQKRKPKFTVPGADYLVVFDEPIKGEVVLPCNHARNVVLIGGEIEILPPAEEGKKGKRRGLYIQHWAGTFHLEGIWIHGANLAEGININAGTPGTVLQIQNCRIDDVKGNAVERANYRAPKTHHPDLIQNWAGPAYWYMDRLTGSTDYQGFMLQPRQFGETDTIWAEFNHINIRHIGNQGYQIFRAGGMQKMVLNEVYLQENAAKAYPRDHEDWKQLKFGEPAGGDFVKAGAGGPGIAGAGYQSPGYEGSAQLSSR